MLKQFIADRRVYHCIVINVKMISRCIARIFLSRLTTGLLYGLTFCHRDASIHRLTQAK